MSLLFHENLPASDKESLLHIANIDVVLLWWFLLLTAINAYFILHLLKSINKSFALYLAVVDVLDMKTAYFCIGS